MKKLLSTVVILAFCAGIIYFGKNYGLIDDAIQAESNTVKENDTYNNVWIEQVNDESIIIVDSDSKKKELLLPEAVKGTTYSDLDNETVADIRIEKGKVAKLRYKKTFIDDSSAHFVVDEQGAVVESDYYGRFEVCENFCQYKVGNEKLQGKKYVFFDGDKVCVIIEFVKEDIKEEDSTNDTKEDKSKVADSSTAENVIVPVVIKNNDYSSIFHDNIEMKSEENFYVVVGDKKYETKQVSFVTDNNQLGMLIQGESINLDGESKVDVDCLNKMKILSMSRCKNVDYCGRFVIYCTKSGFVLVNQPELEEYVRCVVCGEMPKEFSMEALKSQAVCARTYIARIMEKGNRTYNDYNAYVDDSTAYQVYNFQPQNSKADKAVEMTDGQILEYQGEIAKVFYYSTSCGYSANSKDAFGEDCEYLTANIQNGQDYTTIDVLNSCGLSVKMTGMEFNDYQFEQFMDMRQDFIEASSPWFTWRVHMSFEDVVYTLNQLGYSSVTKVNDISITKRGQGGIVNEILIRTNSKDLVFEGQFDIRKALAPRLNEIKRNDTVTVANMTMLPSAFFYMERDENGKKGITLIGGGYGHGVGMSQYGANYLGENGENYKEILEYYYPGTTLKGITLE